MIDSLQWTKYNGQWTMDNGQWTKYNGQWTMDNGQMTRAVIGNFTHYCPCYLSFVHCPL